MTEPSAPADTTASLGTECSAAPFPECLPLEKPALPQGNRPAEARPIDSALDVVERVLDELHGRLGSVEMGPGDLGPVDLGPRHRGERGRLTSLSATARIHPPLTRGDLGMLAQVARTPPDGVRREDELCDRLATGRPPQPPPSIAGFTDLVEVGRGSSGRVYRAWQGSLRRTVALKVMTSDVTAESIGRAQREAQALAVLNHPHVLTIHEAALQHSPPFLVMEWVPGGSLQDRLRRGPLSIAEATQVARQLASGVAACHDLDIVHRDLKPGNVLLATREPESATGTASGETLCVKITDFGLVRLADHSLQLTQEGGVVGTPGYMAPEQTGLRPQLGPVGRLSDIYGVGAVVFAALTGRPPHVGSTPLETLAQAAWEEPVWLPQVRSDIPGDLAVIVSKCLRLAPEHRYASARELLQDLERFESGRPIRARQYTVWQRTRNWMWRHPTASAVGGLTALLLLTGVIGGVFHVVRVNAALTDLEQERTRVVQLLSATEKSHHAERRNRQRTIRQAAVALEMLLHSLTRNPSFHDPHSARMTPSDREVQSLTVLRCFFLEQLAHPEELEQDLSEELARSLNTIAYVEWTWRDHEAAALSDSELVEQLSRRFPNSSILVGCTMRALLMQRRIHHSQSRSEAAEVVQQRLMEMVNRQIARQMSLPPTERIAGLVSSLWALGLPEDGLRLLHLALEAEERRFAEGPQSADVWSHRLSQEALRIGLLQHLGRPVVADHQLRRWLTLSRTFEAAHPERADVLRGERWRMVSAQLRQVDHFTAAERLPSLLALGSACLEEFRHNQAPDRQHTLAALDWCRALLESPQHLLGGSQVEELTEEILRRGEALIAIGDEPGLRLELARVRVLLGEWACIEEQDALGLDHARRAQQHLKHPHSPPTLDNNPEPWRAQLLKACDLAARTSGRLGWTAEELSHLSWAWSLATEEERRKISPRWNELVTQARDVTGDDTPVRP